MLKRLSRGLSSRFRYLFCGCTRGSDLEESDREINTTEPPPPISIIKPPSFELSSTSITELNESPGMAKRKFSTNSPSEDNSKEQSWKKIKSHPPPFYPDNHDFRSLLKNNATRSKSYEQEPSLRPKKATKIFSQSHPTNLYCSDKPSPAGSDTKPSPAAWSQHSHEQLSLHTQHSPKAQQLITPSQCSTFPRKKNNRFSTPHQGSGQIGYQQSSHSWSTKSKCMYN